jgi:hypothetical protein
MSQENNSSKTHQEDQKRKIEQEVLRAIRGISFGSVEVVIHNAKIVQILRKEKVRFQKDGAGASS